MEAASAHFCYCTTDQNCFLFFRLGWWNKNGAIDLDVMHGGWDGGVGNVSIHKGGVVQSIQYMCVSIAAIINYRTMEIERTDGRAKRERPSRALTGRKENQGTKERTWVG